MGVVDIAGVLVPEDTVFAGVGFGDAVVGIVFVAMVKGVGFAGLVVHFVYFSTHLVVIVIDSLEALAGLRR